MTVPGLRNYIFDLIADDTQMISLGYTRNGTFTSNDQDTPQIRPLTVIRWGITNPGMDTERIRSLQVWLHDQPADYTRIDAGLERVRELLENQRGVNAGATNKWLSQVVWESDSDDLTDDIQNTITRYSIYSLIGSAV